MAAPVDVGIAPFLELSGGYTLRFTALDPTTGAVVAGVVISGATVQFSPETSEAPPNPYPDLVNTAKLLPGAGSA